MKLVSWMRKEGFTYRELAEKLKVPHTTLYRYVAGQRKIPLEFAVKISKITDNKVRIEDLLK